MPIYEERINANRWFVAGATVFALAVGLVPGIVMGGLSWLTLLYLVLFIILAGGFFQLKIRLFPDKLVVEYGFLYRKVFELNKIKGCSAHVIVHPVKTYGGWGIRRGNDGTYALTQAFVNHGIRLETDNRVFVISSRVPDAMCSAITSALSK